MKRLPAARPTLAVAVLVLLLAACGGGATDAEGASRDDGGGTATEVTLTDFAFSPAEITVAAGEPVTFVNGDAAAHTVTEGTDGAAVENPVVDEEIGGGGEAEITFDEPGTYEITCLFHPQMNMTVVVEG
jgi:plastocyanin